jgi:hypothetical protein
MIPDEKDLIDALLEALENLYTANVVLAGRLRRAKQRGFHDNVGTEGVEAAAVLARTSFRKLYGAPVRSGEGWSAILKDLPVSDDIQ